MLKAKKKNSDDWGLGELIEGVNRLGVVHEELEKIALDIRQRHRRVITDCLAIGEELLKARNLMRVNYAKGEVSGCWCDWLESKVGISRKLGTTMIWVYEKNKRMCAGAHPPLDVNFAVHVELANPKADQEAVAEVEAELRQGQKMTRREVRARVSSKGKTAKKSKKVPMKDANHAVYPWVNEAKDHLEKALDILKTHKKEEFKSVCTLILELTKLI